MQKMVLVGIDNYEKFIREDGYYVDKTELIYELADRTRNEVTLFTRPRRFGKTLTMSMMESFFDISRDSSDVFKGKKIAENHPAFCEDWMNQYPVLFLSLKDVEGRNFEIAYRMLRAAIADLCKKNDFLADKESVNAFDREIFMRLQAKEANEEEIRNSLKTIMRMMNPKNLKSS